MRPGNESKMALDIAAIFNREGIPYESLEPVRGRASIVARLRGTERPDTLCGRNVSVLIEDGSGSW
jgi:hypothetical protein